MTAFERDSRRDASPTIRGFVYQTDLTVQRWLALKEMESLELESGEDIDTIVRGIAGDENEERILEQVKDQRAPLTLRSASALESVANFALHRERNPNIRLRFRFTTTAPVGREQGSPFPSGQPGVVVWQRLWNRVAVETSDSDAASDLRAFYRELHQPTGVGGDAWAALRRVVEAPDERWIGFLLAFEWSTSSDQLPSVGATIRADLIRLGLAADEGIAIEQHRTLFIHVIRLLSTAGEKRLTRSELGTVLAGPRDKDLDRRVASLFHRIELVETRVDSIEMRLVGLELQQDNWASTIAHLTESSSLVELSTSLVNTTVAMAERFLIATGNDAAPVVSLIGTAVLEDIPPTPARVTRRSNAVAALGREVAARTWTAVRGEPETGKTQLAVLLAQEWSDVRWFSSAGLSSPEALVLRLRSIAGAIDGNLSRGVIVAVPQGTLFVFDDLPALDNRDMRSRLLCSLAVVGRNHIHFLSLSSSKAPRLIRDVLGDQFASLTIPSFSDEEARDLLLLYGAPPKLSDRTVEFFNALAHGNPTLLTALARYLDSRAWHIDAAELERLLSGAHLEEIGRELMMRLRNEVQDAATRELFSRTRLAQGGLTLEDIRSLGEVDPAIDRITERVLDLDDLWLRRESMGRYAPTPLAKALPTGDLQRTTEKRCHVVLAERIIGTGRMNRNAVVDAVYHFMQATEFNRAGSLLAYALARIIQDEAWSEKIIPAMYTQAPLPPEMALHLRLYIRTQQLKIARMQGGYPAQLLQDSLNLVHEASLDEAALVANFATEVAFEDTGHHEIWSVAMDALSKLTELKPNAEDLSFMGQALPAQTWAMLFYMVGRTVRTVADVDRWTAAADRLPNARRQQVLATAVDRLSLINAAWRRVSKSGRQPWTEVLAVHRRWKAWAERIGDDLLWAYAIRAEVIVRAEYLNESQDALTLANETLARASGAHERFILNETIATQLRRLRQYEDAEHSYEAAFADFDSATPTEQVYALHAASGVIARHDPARAAGLLERASDIVRNSVNEFDSARWAIVSADLGLAYWHSGRARDAFNEWDVVASALISGGSIDEESGRGLIALLTVVLRQISNIFERIKADESERAVVGTFDRNIIALAEHWKPAQTALMAAAMALIGAKVGREDRAFVWIDHAVAAARELNDPIVTAFVALEALPWALARNDFDNALRLTLELRGARGRPKPGDSELAQYVLLIAFQLCALMLTQSHAARGAMLSVGAGLRRVTGEPDASVLADLLAAASKTNNTDEMEEFCAGTQPGTAVWATALLLRGSSPGQNTIERVADHIAIAPHIFARASLWTGMYTRVVLSFFEAFWQHEISVNAFRFRAPSNIRREIERIHTLPAAQRLQRLLETVSDALGLNLSREFRDWFRNTGQSR